MRQSLLIVVSLTIFVLENRCDTADTLTNISHCDIMFKVNYPLHDRAEKGDRLC